MTNAADQMTISALQPWFGGKRTLAPRIVESLGEHVVYWELFCGSCAVLFAKPTARMETVNDLHGDLVNLARVVKCEEMSARLHWKLVRTIPTEELYYESRDIITRQQWTAPAADVNRAYHYFVHGWLGMSGFGGTKGTNTTLARRFSGTGGAPATRFTNAVDSLPWWHERLRSVLVLSTCGIETAEKIRDEPGTAIYADPPYLVKTGEYVHDFKPEDHRRLAAALCKFKCARVVVSYYDHPQLAELYPGWVKLIATGTKSITAGGMRKAGRVDAPEVLLVNPFQAAPPNRGVEQNGVEHSSRTEYGTPRHDAARTRSTLYQML